MYCVTCVFGALDMCESPDSPMWLRRGKAPHTSEGLRQLDVCDKIKGPWSHQNSALADQDCINHIKTPRDQSLGLTVNVREC